MSARTALQAAIKRATLAAQREVVKLDASALDDLERLYQRAAADIAQRIAAYSGADGNVALQELQSVLDQANARLRALAEQRNALLNGNLAAAAALGTQPLVGGAAMSSAAAMQINHEALQFVRTFVASDGLQLSDRIWRLDRHARDVVTNTIEMAVIQGHGAAQAAREFLASGKPVPMDVEEKVGAANAMSIGKQISGEMMTGPGSPMDNAMRLMRTEINRAHGEAYIKGVFAHEDVAGVRFLLSPGHPKPDICDLHSTANLYGLGAGVYPTRESCPWPAHPNTLSFVEVVFKDEVTEGDKAGKETPMQALERLTPAQRIGVLGKNKAEAFNDGKLTQGMIKSPWRVIRQRIGNKPPAPKAAPIKAPQVMVDSLQWISRNISGSVSLSGATTRQIDAIRRGLEIVMGGLGQRLGAIGWIPARRSPGANAYYQRMRFGHSPGNNDAMHFRKSYATNPEEAARKSREAFAYNKERNIVRLEKMLSGDSLSEAEKERARSKLRAVVAAKRWSASSDAADPLFVTAAHESGHAVYFSHPDIQAIWKAKLKQLEVSAVDMAKVSEYGGSNVDELFAEVTALIADGRRDEVPSSLLRVYKATMERKK